MTQGDGKYAFRVQEDRAVLTSLMLGNPIGDMVEVIDGLKAGDQVVLDPPAKLKSGAKIKAGE